MSFQKLVDMLSFSKSKAEKEHKNQNEPVLSTSPCHEMDVKRCDPKLYELASTQNGEKSDEMLPKENKTPPLPPVVNGSKKRKERSPDTEEADADTKKEVKKSFIQSIFGKHSTDQFQGGKILSNSHTSDKKQVHTDSENHSISLVDIKLLKSMHHRAKSFHLFKSNKKIKATSPAQKGNEKASHTNPGSPNLSIDSSSDSFSVLVCSQEDITSESNQCFSYSFEETDACVTKDEDYDKTLENIDDSEDDLDHIVTLSQSPLLIRNTFKTLSTTQKVDTCSSEFNINNTDDKFGSHLQLKGMEEPLENCKHIVQVHPSTPNVRQQSHNELEFIQYCKGKTDVKLEYDSSEEARDIKKSGSDVISRPYNGSRLPHIAKCDAFDKDSHRKHKSDQSENVQRFIPQWTEGSVYSRQLLKSTFLESPLCPLTSNKDKQREFSLSPPWLHQTGDGNSNSDNMEMEETKDLSFRCAASRIRSSEMNAYRQTDKRLFQSPCVTPPCRNKNLRRHLSWGSVRDKSTSLADTSPYLASSFSKKLISQFNLPKYNINGLMSFEPGIDIIDTHCHLDFLFRRIGFKGTYLQYQKVNKNTYPVCYGGCIADFCDPSTFGLPILWKDLLEEDKLWAAFGCHPHMAEQYNPEIEMHLIDALQHAKVVALGEIGLDYSPKNRCDPEIQHNVLRKQLKIAVAHKIPIVIHCRDAHDDCLKILKEVSCGD
ncbi:uncharacterized protein LOC143251058 isoform X1 [Tachypleus tridentatus]|uniref:uncharacterized protein LOC143251058 isoform X1 n=1 Tax=Tachypleus tridentatus TaxID=6853 RepID=UPI003FD3312E